MITIQHTEESLSCAYVQAVAGKAGLIFSIRNHDYGFDGTFHEVANINGRRIETGYKIDYQLKATKNWSLDNGSVVYDMEAKTHKDLVERANRPHATQSILVLLCLPENIDHWVEQTENELFLRRCCYWEFLKGNSTTNKAKQRIRISRAQQLTPAAIMDMFNRIKNGMTIK